MLDVKCQIHISNVKSKFLVSNAKKIQNAKIKIQNDNSKFKTSLAQSVKRKGTA